MTPATAKRKGAETEEWWCEYLRANGAPHAERRHLAGSFDKGDIAGLPGQVHEVKSGARLDLSGWMDELRVEVRNAGAAFGVLVIRPKGKPNPSDWWCVVTPGTLTALMQEAGWLVPPAELDRPDSEARWL
jgi:hypothetical protein